MLIPPGSLAAYIAIKETNVSDIDVATAASKVEFHPAKRSEKFRF